MKQFIMGYETALNSKKHHLVVNKLLEGDDLHMHDESIKVIRPEPILVQMVPNTIFPAEPNIPRITGNWIDDKLSPK